MEPLFVGIDAGGTSFKIAVGTGKDACFVTETRIPTTTPKETLDNVVAWLNAHAAHCVALGMACFGPLDVANGALLTTPKAGWAGTQLVAPLQFAMDQRPVALDTDVNAAAVAEWRIGGHGDHVQSLAYITVGTGVGVGLVCDRQTVRGALHPEMGHIRVCRDVRDTAFAGTCPFHGACVEGLVANAALAARFGVDAAALDTVPDEHPGWDIVAYYLGQLCATIALTVAPHCIVVSGGVMNRRSLFPKVRAHFRTSIAGYLSFPEMMAEDYIRPSKFGDASGLVGAIQLAVHAQR